MTENPTDRRHTDKRLMRWGVFGTGVVVGLALGALIVAATLAQRRRARRALPWSRRRAVRSPPPPDAASVSAGEGETAAARAARTWPDEAEIDEELAQTFPASDPLPYSHRVD